MASLLEIFLGSCSSSAPPVDWEAEAYPEYADYAVLPLLLAFFPALRLLLNQFLFEVLARRLIFGKGYDKLAETDERRKKINKFKESAWKFVYYLSAELFSLSVTYNESWFTNTRYFWVGPGEQLWPDQKMKLKLKAVYMYAAGFYVYSIFDLLLWETRRKDFGVMMSHHVATIVLIVVSYICRLSRPGSVILPLHDASDIFLEIGKMAKYSSCEWLAVVAFLLFVASWILLRLIVFPFWILRSTSYEIAMIVDNENRKIYRTSYYYLFNTLLFSLLVFHIYWWVLIYRMLVKQIQSRGHVGEDVRSDSEGENNHED
ncbi:ASC1-like protein 1 [Triticum urartu]|uniref:TLC domain-containing protein n=1 Tax=Triticum urartu TaxID=4572 RepID=A0A8R7QES7_TRIUA|nr:ASC1-like protein 1 [Triticum urartu]XP_048529982.1 ASC1-like protein 1 [Triticum urartu]